MRSRLVPTLGLAIILAASACGGEPASRRGADAPSDESGEHSEQRVVYERMPDGSVKKTTIPKRTVAAPPPPAPPADPYPDDPLVVYNVDRINAYRKTKGLPPLL